MSETIEFALVPDHTAQALGLLIDQFQGLPRFSGLVASYVNRVQEFEYVLWDVVNKRLLDYTALDGTSAHAVAAQLDAIGRLVGLGRAGQDDATYLIFIRAQIFLNKSRARRDQIIKLITLIEATSFTYQEFYPGSVYLDFAAPTVSPPAVLLQLAQTCVTGGVHLYIVIPATGHTAATSFAFSNYGTTSDPNRSFGNDGSTLYGGALASEYS